MSQDIVLLKGNEINALLKNREVEIMDAVAKAYVTHGTGDSNLPHSTFLRFPAMERERIIGLPAFLGGDFAVAGMKWIASFPGNLSKGLERASATLILNATDTGYPVAILESSIISAKRTAASAAVAAHEFCGDRPVEAVGLVGCGLINFETLRFLLVKRSEIHKVLIFDISAERAAQFSEKCGELGRELTIESADSIDQVLKSTSLVALATTTVKPHISDLSGCPEGAVILHTSLRDFTSEVILACDNVVDDLDHVCRAQTSIHLAAQASGDTGFVRCGISKILSGAEPPRRSDGAITIFSPFGLGVLDLAVGQLAYKTALEKQIGTTISGFLPDHWMAR